MLHQYKDQLKSWIEGNVSLCERSLFIFDEVDKLPVQLLDVVTPYLDYHTHINGVDYRKSIFLFLSNTGGLELSQHTFELWKSGKKKESLKLADLDSIRMTLASNVDNNVGLWSSQLISKHLESAHVTFLPLERKHVRGCIIDGLERQNYFKHDGRIPEETVETVMAEIKFYPVKEQLYSVKGYKNVKDKTDLLLMELIHSKEAEKEL